MRAVGSPRLGWAGVPERVVGAVEAALGGRVRDAVDQQGGFSPGCAARVSTVAGDRAFVKAVSESLNPDSVRLIREEAAALAVLPSGLPIAGLRTVIEIDDWVVAVLDDIDGRTPDTPWRAGDVDAVLATLERVWAIDAPQALPETPELVELGAWQAVAEDPAGVDPELIERLPQLIEAEEHAHRLIAGDHLVHCDVRADNVLLRSDRTAILIDWAYASRGAGWLDTLMLALDCVAQGGPDADHLLASAPTTCNTPPEAMRSVLAALAGHFVNRARRPAAPGLPTIRAWQAHCAAVAMQWHDTSRLWT